MQWSQILISVLGTLGLLLAASLTYVYQQNLKLREQQNVEKQKAYKELIKTLDNVRYGNEPDIVAKMREHTRDVVYYGSTGVIKALGDYQQFIWNEFDASKSAAGDQSGLLSMKLLGELMLQIRRDLGNVKWWHKIWGKHGEKWSDIMRLSITDMEKYLPRSYTKRRGRKHSGPSIRLNGKRNR